MNKYSVYVKVVVSVAKWLGALVLPVLLAQLRSWTLQRFVKDRPEKAPEEASEKANEKKAPEKNSPEKKSSENRSVETKSVEKKPDDKKVTQKKTDEEKTGKKEGEAPMPQRDRPTILDDERYEALREKGMSKEKAARIANTPRKEAGQRGGKSPKYEEWSKEDLYKKAQEVGIEGRSKMSKEELINALRNH